MPAFLNRCLTTCLQADSTVAPPMDWLHFHVRFGMKRRARPPPIRLHHLPAVRTDCLLVPPISMVQQQLPWYLSFQLPLKRRRLACYLSKGRLRALFPPNAHISSNISSAARACLAFASSRFIACPFAILNPYSSSTPFQPHKTMGCTPARSARSVLSPMHCCPSHGFPRLFTMRNITQP